MSELAKFGAVADSDSNKVESQIKDNRSIPVPKLPAMPKLSLKYYKRSMNYKENNDCFIPPTENNDIVFIRSSISSPETILNDFTKQTKIRHSKFIKFFTRSY